jgi:hypothetical protein
MVNGNEQMVNGNEQMVNGNEQMINTPGNLINKTYRVTSNYATQLYNYVMECIRNATDLNEPIDINTFLNRINKHNGMTKLNWAMESQIAKNIFELYMISTKHAKAGRWEKIKPLHNNHLKYGFRTLMATGIITLEEISKQSPDERYLGSKYGIKRYAYASDIMKSLDNISKEHFPKKINHTKHATIQFERMARLSEKEIEKHKVWCDISISKTKITGQSESHFIIALNFDDMSGRCYPVHVDGKHNIFVC